MKSYNQKQTIDKAYLNTLKVLNTEELLKEKESVYEICQYVSYENPYRLKKLTIDHELSNRGLRAVNA